MPSQPNDSPRLPALPADIRGPLAKPQLHHPEHWAPASSQLSFAAVAAGLLLLLSFLWWPELAPSGLVAWLLAAIAGAILPVVALVCRSRGGLLHPRLLTLGLALAALGSCFHLGYHLLQGKDPSRLACALSLAWAAAAGCLSLRLGLGRCSPLDRVLAYSGLLGLGTGLMLALALRGLLPPLVELFAVTVPGTVISHDSAALCSEAAAVASSDLRPVVAGTGGATLERLAVLHRRLASSPADWEGLSASSRTTCEAAAAAFATLLDTVPPTPADLAHPVFEHAPRPPQAGTRSAELPRDPAPARQLYAELGFLSEGLAARLGAGSDAGRRLAQTRTTFTDGLGGSWLDGWLLPAWLGSGATERSTLARLLAMPGQTPGRIDQWLRLDLEAARRLAIDQPACALREPYDGDLKRQQVLDCGLLGVSAKNEIDLIGELGLVYSSAVKRSPLSPPPPISAARDPDSLRLLVEIPRDSPDAATAALLANLEAAISAAGGRFHRLRGGGFEIDYGGPTIRASASTADLPGGRLALHLSFRYPEAGS